MRKCSKVGLTPRGAQSRKKDYLRRKKVPAVEQKSNATQVGPKISMIGAAAMDKHLREGVPAYFLHISVLKDINYTPETLKATKLEPSDGEEVVPNLLTSLDLAPSKTRHVHHTHYPRTIPPLISEVPP